MCAQGPDAKCGVAEGTDGQRALTPLCTTSPGLWRLGICWWKKGKITILERRLVRQTVFLWTWGNFRNFQAQFISSPPGRHKQSSTKKTQTGFPIFYTQSLFSAARTTSEGSAFHMMWMLGASPRLGSKINTACHIPLQEVLEILRAVLLRTRGKPEWLGGRQEALWWDGRLLVERGKNTFKPPGLTSYRRRLVWYVATSTGRISALLNIPLLDCHGDNRFYVPPLTSMCQLGTHMKNTCIYFFIHFQNAFCSWPTDFY